MHRILLTTFIFLTVVPLSPSGGIEPASPRSSLDPIVRIEGGSSAARTTVLDAVDRFVTTGLPLPDLEVHIHEDNTGCGGFRGLFHGEGGIGMVDLCFSGEFLALHELGHAWAGFNLDDDVRAAFVEMSGSPAWLGSDIAWHHRGTELAADAIAHGLLSPPLEAGQHARDIERFEFLTGMPSPREVVVSAVPAAAIDLTDAERSATAAYAEWRRSALATNVAA